MTEELWHPRCCDVIGLGDGAQRRYLLELGAYHPEVVAELSAAGVRALADGLAEMAAEPVGAVRLRVPSERVSLRLRTVVVSRTADGVEVSGWASPAPATSDPDLRVVLTEQAAARLGRSCRAALSPRETLCPFCGLVLEPGGHVCPRANGYRR